jgi:hypothetical protein
MDTMEYVMRMGAKVQESFEAGEQMSWAERVAAASAAVVEEEQA